MYKSRTRNLAPKRSYTILNGTLEYELEMV
jgi:hypothetical protein